MGHLVLAQWLRRTFIAQVAVTRMHRRGAVGARVDAMRPG